MHKIPLWLKVSYTIMVAVIVPVYWREYGPQNFLWFSDIALFATMIALWLESRLIASMMALSVLFLEIIWVIGFLSGGTVFNIADYMFDQSIPLYLRALSLFHFPMPLTILYMLYRLGYDPRALKYQSILGPLILMATWGLNHSSENINWVRPPDFLTGRIDSNLYLIVLIVALITIVYIPSHYFFQKWFIIKTAQDDR